VLVSWVRRKAEENNQYLLVYVMHSRASTAQSSAYWSLRVHIFWT